MRFRPCIDLHDGAVKQIVGGTLRDGDASCVTTNFVASAPAAAFARRYAAAALPGGHVIMLGAASANTAEACAALAASPGGLQVGGACSGGVAARPALLAPNISTRAACHPPSSASHAGGITPTNASAFLRAGASHVIVTSYVFRDGAVDWARLAEMEAAAGGRERLVLDLSCRRRPRPAAAGGGADYVVVTDRWQRWTDVAVDASSLAKLAAHCAEFLVHGVDVEGLRAGVEDDLVRLLGEHSPIPVTYAGGVRDMADVERVRALGGGRVDVSVGSALDIFGGSLSFDGLVRWSHAQAH